MAYISAFILSFERKTVTCKAIWRVWDKDSNCSTVQHEGGQLVTLATTEMVFLPETESQPWVH